ncbi:MAG: YdcF family protein, partial [Gemmatimonadaceae bacterium]|nr:YdcF family protein [Gemmatimonadaceae bacterium]
TAVIAYTPLIEGPVQGLVRRDAPLPGSPAPDAVIALGSDITSDSLLTGQSLDRVLTAATLVKDGVAPRLVLTRNLGRYGRRRIPSTPDQQRVAALVGIDASQVQVVDSVFSTRDEAVRAWALLAPQGVRRVVVVTSPAHSGRACRTFQRVGFAVVCTPSVSRDVPFTRATARGSAARLAAFRLWLYERLAFQYYHLKSWI